MSHHDIKYTFTQQPPEKQPRSFFLALPMFWFDLGCPKGLGRKDWGAAPASWEMAPVPAQGSQGKLSVPALHGVTSVFKVHLRQIHLQSPVLISSSWGLRYLHWSQPWRGYGLPFSTLSTIFALIASFPSKCILPHSFDTSSDLPPPPPCLLHQFSLPSRSLWPSQSVAAPSPSASYPKPLHGVRSWPPFPGCSLHPTSPLRPLLLLMDFSFPGSPSPLSIPPVQTWVFWVNCHLSWRQYKKKKKSETITILSRAKISVLSACRKRNWQAVGFNRKTRLNLWIIRRCHNPKEEPNTPRFPTGDNSCVTLPMLGSITALFCGTCHHAHKTTCEQHCLPQGRMQLAHTRMRWMLVELVSWGTAASLGPLLTYIRPFPGVQELGFPAQIWPEGGCPVFRLGEGACQHRAGSSRGSGTSKKF